MAKPEYLAGKGIPFTRKKPYSVHIKDGYTPKMRAAEYYLPLTLEYASLRCRDIINNNIKQKFMERRAKGPHKTPTSKKLYQQWGYIPNVTLLMSGQLEDAVIDLKAEHYHIRHHYVVDVYSNFPHYTGYMEFGVKRTGGFIPGKRIKARPFIMDALKESMTEVQEEYGAAIGSINALFADPMEKYAPPLEVSSTKELSLLQFGALGMYGILFTLMPPTVLLAAYGAFFDIESLMTGRFTAATTMMFVRSMLLGRAGMTKKVWRRKIRRRIWT